MRLDTGIEFIVRGTKMNHTYGVGSTVFETWIIKHKLGEGSYGRVFEIERSEFGQTYQAALKVITVPQSSSEITRRRTRSSLPTMQRSLA